MSLNWSRHFELLLAASDGQGISLSDFKVTFNIEWFEMGWPRVATIKVYNLKQDTVNKIIGNEFSRLKIIAGYNGLTEPVNESDVGRVREIEPGKEGQTAGMNYGEIFNGEIRFTITGRDNPTDTFVLVQAVDGHQAYNNSVTSTTLAAGYSVADIHRIAMRDFADYGVTQGITGAFTETRMPRGRVMFGPTRDFMSNVAAQCKATWQFVDGQIQMVPINAYIHEAITLNSNTGLIGLPQQTMGNGINIRCLINPNIRVGGLVELNQQSVYRTQLSNSEISKSGGRIFEENQNGNLTVQGTTSNPSSIATDGVYRVNAISYTGDTRGRPWYMDLMCIARGDSTLLSQKAISAGL